MLLKNLNTSAGLVNGTRGKVIGFQVEQSSIYDSIPIVEFYCTVGERTFIELQPIKEESWDIKQGDE